MFGQIIYSCALAALAASQNLAMARHLPIGHPCEIQAADTVQCVSPAGSGSGGGRLPYRLRIRSDSELFYLIEAT